MNDKNTSALNPLMPLIWVASGPPFVLGIVWHGSSQRGILGMARNRPVGSQLFVMIR